MQYGVPRKTGDGPVHTNKGIAGMYTFIAFTCLSCPRTLSSLDANFMPILNPHRVSMGGKVINLKFVSNFGRIIGRLIYIKFNTSLDHISCDIY